MSDWVRLDDATYLDLRRNLLRERGSEVQRHFLEMVLNDGEFLQFLRDKVSRLGTKEMPTLDRPLTESEFNNAPAETEEDLYHIWKSLVPNLAAQGGLWAAATLHFAQRGLIRVSYLAAPSIGPGTGRRRITSLLRQGRWTSDRARTDADRCVRTVLRRLGGLPEVRGGRSLISNCPFARAWWRERFIQECCVHVEASPMDERALREFFRCTTSHWENLVTAIFCRNSVMGTPSTRSAAMICIARASQRRKETPGGTGRHYTEKQQVAVLRRFCQIAAPIELGYLDCSKTIHILEQAANA